MKSAHQGAPVTSVSARRVHQREWLVTGGKDCTVALYDLSDANDAGAPQRNDANATDRYVSRTQAYEESVAHALSRRHKRPLLTSTPVPPYPCHSLATVAFHPSDAGTFLTADMSGLTLLWDTERFTPVVRGVLRGNVTHAQWNTHTTWSCCTTSGSLTIYDGVSGQPAAAIPDACVGPMLDFAWRPGREEWEVTTAGMDGTVKTWDIRRR